MSDKDICVVKLGTPDVARGMMACGQVCEYLTVARAAECGMPWSGWYHIDRSIIDHHAVPKRMIY